MYIDLKKLSMLKKQIVGILLAVIFFATKGRWWISNA